MRARYSDEFETVKSRPLQGNIMKNIGYRGNIPNPKAEGAVVSLHYNLAKYMGTGTPRSIK
jgi:hypothetical protein